MKVYLQNGNTDELQDLMLKSGRFSAKKNDELYRIYVSEDITGVILC